jgi:hypothetical protein
MVIEAVDDGEGDNLPVLVPRYGIVDGGSVSGQEIDLTQRTKECRAESGLRTPLE